jgi:acyl-CoA thioester hydrolase
MRRFHETLFGIYFDDLDPFNILHNARYLLLFERALGAFWMDVGWGSFQDEDRPEQFHLVRHNAIEYLSPVRGVCRVRIRVEVASIGRTSLNFGFRMLPLDRDVDHARGTRTVVHVDPRTLEGRPWDAEFRAAMAGWIDSGGPAGATRTEPNP